MSAFKLAVNKKGPGMINPFIDGYKNLAISAPILQDILIYLVPDHHSQKRGITVCC